jgi:hypothetical protein
MRSAWFSTGTGRPHTAIGASPTVLVFSMPRSWAAISKRVNSPLRNVTTSCGGIGEADEISERDCDLGEAVGDPRLAVAEAVGNRCRQNVDAVLWIIQARARQRSRDSPS